MIEKKKKNDIYNKIIFFCDEHKNLYESKNGNAKIITDPINKLISNYEDIKEIYEKKEENKKIFYFNRKIISKILCDYKVIFSFNKEKFEIINDSIIIFNTSELFYLSLLVSLPNIRTNFDYPVDNIILLYDYIENNKLKPFQKLILSKIVIDLINNYKYCKYDKYIKYIKKCKAIIEYKLEHIDIQIPFDVNKNIDYLYIQIIIALIKENKFEDYNYCNDIIEQLDLKYIDITETMFIELSKFLNNENNQKGQIDYMKDYTINTIKDFTKKKNKFLLYIN